MDQLSLFTVDIPRKRSLIRPLDSAVAIWNVLSVLPVGAEVPALVRILDYEDGDIPVWVLQERESHPPIQILTLVDSATRKSDWLGQETAIAIDFFIAPTKILSASKYLWSPECEKRRDKLGDPRQDARKLNERNDEELCQLKRPVQPMLLQCLIEVLSVQASLS